jgi:hypothetical protein
MFNGSVSIIDLLKRVRIEAVSDCSEELFYYLCGGIEEITKNRSISARHVDLNLNLGIPEYEVEMLTTTSHHSVNCEVKLLTELLTGILRY